MCIRDRLCASCDRSGHSAWPEVAPGLTPHSIQQNYAQTVVSTRIVPGCVQFLGEEKRFYTAWVKNGPDGPETLLPVYLEQRTSPDRHGWSVQCHSRPSRQLSGRAAGLWSRSITNAPISSLWIYFNYCGLPPILSGLPCASDVM